MKIFLISASILISLNVWCADIGTFPDGLFEGKGIARFPSGATANYNATLKAESNRLDITYKFANGGPTMEFTQQLDFAQSGLITVLMAGKLVGQGFCFGSTCHLAGDAGTGQYANTWIFSDKSIECAGSGQIPTGEKFYFKDTYFRK